LKHDFSFVLDYAATLMLAMLVTLSKSTYSIASSAADKSGHRDQFRLHAFSETNPDFLCELLRRCMTLSSTRPALLRFSLHLGLT